ncbi:hypothetical protein G4B88_003133, partial [Cannabis sativa]
MVLPADQAATLLVIGLALSRYLPSVGSLRRSSLIFANVQSCSAPIRKGPKKLSSYESGIELMGDAWLQFRIFFLYPWAMFRCIGGIRIYRSFNFRTYPNCWFNLCMAKRSIRMKAVCFGRSLYSLGRATVGEVGNVGVNRKSLGRAGSKRWLGKRLVVRGGTKLRHIQIRFQVTNRVPQWQRCPPVSVSSRIRWRATHPIEGRKLLDQSKQQDEKNASFNLKLHFHLTPIVMINGSSLRDLLLNSQNFCRSTPGGAENPSLSWLCYRRLWGSRNRRALILICKDHDWELFDRLSPRKRRNIINLNSAKLFEILMDK